MAKFGIGQAVTRVEDQRFLTGQGRYVDDIVLPAMAHGVNVLSPHAHAKIKSIDVSKAKTAPGRFTISSFGSSRRRRSPTALRPSTTSSIRQR